MQSCFLSDHLTHRPSTLRWILPVRTNLMLVQAVKIDVTNFVHSFSYSKVLVEDLINCLMTQCGNFPLYSHKIDSVTEIKAEIMEMC